MHTNARPGFRNHSERFDVLDALDPASIAAELRRESTFHGRTTSTTPALLRRLHFKADGIPKTIVCSVSDVDSDKCTSVRRFGMGSFSNLVVSLTRSQRDFHKFDESEHCEGAPNPNSERFEKGIHSTSSDTILNLSPSLIPDVQQSPKQHQSCRSETRRRTEISDPIYDHVQCHRPHALQQQDVSEWSGRSERNLQSIGALGLGGSFAGNHYSTNCMPSKELRSKSKASTEQRNDGSRSKPHYVANRPINEHASSNGSYRALSNGRQPRQDIPEPVLRENLPCKALSNSHTTIQASSAYSGPRTQMYLTANTAEHIVANNGERFLNVEFAMCAKSKLSGSVPCSFSTRNYDESESKSNSESIVSDIDSRRLHNESHHIHNLVAPSETTLRYPMKEKLLEKAKFCPQLPTSRKGQLRTYHGAQYMDSLFAPNGPEVYQ